MVHVSFWSLSFTDFCSENAIPDIHCLEQLTYHLTFFNSIYFVVHHGITNWHYIMNPLSYLSIASVLCKQMECKQHEYDAFLFIVLFINGSHIEKVLLTCSAYLFNMFECLNPGKRKYTLWKHSVSIYSSQEKGMKEDKVSWCPIVISFHGQFSMAPILMK